MAERIRHRERAPSAGAPPLPHTPTLPTEKMCSVFCDEEFFPQSRVSDQSQRRLHFSSHPGSAMCRVCATGARKRAGRPPPPPTRSAVSVTCFPPLSPCISALYHGIFLIPAAMTRLCVCGAPLTAQRRIQAVDRSSHSHAEQVLLLLDCHA